VIAAVVIPAFDLRAALRLRPELETAPAALAPLPGTEAFVGSVTAAAAARGVRPGMRLGEALATCPQLVLVEQDPATVEQSWEEILRRLEELRPDVIAAFPGVLCRIARVIAGSRPTTLRPRFFVTGGEVLTPLMRQQITEAFGVPVVEHYGTHEFGTVAWQCTKMGGLHVSDDGVIVEVLKDGRPAHRGEAGEVVATRLHGFAMPFIRYRLGDLVTQGDPSCPCGAPFSTIFTVQGRMLDYFPLPDGRVLHPYSLVMVILDHGKRWIGQYQLTQERRDRVVLRVVPQVTPSNGDIASFEGAAREHLGPGIEFQVTLVPDIPPEANGKFRVSRSLVESDYDGIDWDHRRAMDLPPQPRSAPRP